MDKDKSYLSESLSEMGFNYDNECITFALEQSAYNVDDAFEFLLNTSPDILKELLNESQSYKSQNSSSRKKKKKHNDQKPAIAANASSLKTTTPLPPPSTPIEVNRSASMPIDRAISVPLINNPTVPASLIDHVPLALPTSTIVSPSPSAWTLPLSVPTTNEPVTNIQTSVPQTQVSQTPKPSTDTISSTVWGGNLDDIGLGTPISATPSKQSKPSVQSPYLSRDAYKRQERKAHLSAVYQDVNGYFDDDYAIQQAILLSQLDQNNNNAIQTPNPTTTTTTTTSTTNIDNSLSTTSTIMSTPHIHNTIDEPNSTHSNIQTSSVNQPPLSSESSKVQPDIHTNHLMSTLYTIQDLLHSIYNHKFDIDTIQSIYNDYIYEQDLQYRYNTLMGIAPSPSSILGRHTGGDVPSSSSLLLGQQGYGLYDRDKRYNTTLSYQQYKEREMARDREYHSQLLHLTGDMAHYYQDSSDHNTSTRKSSINNTTINTNESNIDLLPLHYMASPTSTSQRNMPSVSTTTQSSSVLQAPSNNATTTNTTATGRKYAYEQDEYWNDPSRKIHTPITLSKSERKRQNKEAQEKAKQAKLEKERAKNERLHAGRGSKADILRNNNDNSHDMISVEFSRHTSGSSGGSGANIPSILSKTTSLSHHASLSRNPSLSHQSSNERRNGLQQSYDDFEMVGSQHQLQSSTISPSSSLFKTPQLDRKSKHSKQTENALYNNADSILQQAPHCEYTDTSLPKSPIIIRPSEERATIPQQRNNNRHGGRQSETNLVCNRQYTQQYPSFDDAYTDDGDDDKDDSDNTFYSDRYHYDDDYDDDNAYSGSDDDDDNDKVISKYTNQDTNQSRSKQRQYPNAKSVKRNVYKNKKNKQQTKQGQSQRRADVTPIRNIADKPSQQTTTTQPPRLSDTDIKRTEATTGISIGQTAIPQPLRPPLSQQAPTSHPAYISSLPTSIMATISPQDIVNFILDNETVYQKRLMLSVQNAASNLSVDSKHTSQAQSSRLGTTNNTTSDFTSRYGQTYTNMINDGIVYILAPGYVLVPRNYPITQSSHLQSDDQVGIDSMANREKAADTSTTTTTTPITSPPPLDLPNLPMELLPKQSTHRTFPPVLDDHNNNDQLHSINDHNSIDTSSQHDASTSSPTPPSDNDLAVSTDYNQSHSCTFLSALETVTSQQPPKSTQKHPVATLPGTTIPISYKLNNTHDNSTNNNNIDSDLSLFCHQFGTIAHSNLSYTYQSTYLSMFVSLPSHLFENILSYLTVSDIGVLLQLVQPYVLYQQQIVQLQDAINYDNGYNNHTDSDDDDDDHRHTAFPHSITIDDSDIPIPISLDIRKSNASSSKLEHETMTILSHDDTKSTTTQNRNRRPSQSSTTGTPRLSLASVLSPSPLLTNTVPPSPLLTPRGSPLAPFSLGGGGGGEATESQVATTATDTMTTNTTRTSPILIHTPNTSIPGNMVIPPLSLLPPLASLPPLLPSQDMAMTSGFPSISPQVASSVAPYLVESQQYQQQPIAVPPTTTTTASTTPPVPPSTHHSLSSRATVSQRVDDNDDDSDDNDDGRQGDGNREPLPPASPPDVYDLDSYSIPPSLRDAPRPALSSLSSHSGTNSHTSDETHAPTMDWEYASTHSSRASSNVPSSINQDSDTQRIVNTQHRNKAGNATTTTIAATSVNSATLDGLLLPSGPASSSTSVSLRPVQSGELQSILQSLCNNINNDNTMSLYSDSDANINITTLLAKTIPEQFIMKPVQYKLISESIQLPLQLQSVCKVVARQDIYYPTMICHNNNNNITKQRWGLGAPCLHHQPLTTNIIQRYNTLRCYTKNNDIIAYHVLFFNKMMIYLNKVKTFSFGRDIPMTIEQPPSATTTSMLSPPSLSRPSLSISYTNLYDYNNNTHTNRNTDLLRYLVPYTPYQNDITGCEYNDRYTTNTSKLDIYTPYNNYNNLVYVTTAASSTATTTTINKDTTSSSKTTTTTPYKNIHNKPSSSNNTTTNQTALYNPDGTRTHLGALTYISSLPYEQQRIFYPNCTTTKINNSILSSKYIPSLIGYFNHIENIVLSNLKLPIQLYDLLLTKLPVHTMKSLTIINMPQLCENSTLWNTFISVFKMMKLEYLSIQRCNITDTQLIQLSTYIQQSVLPSSSSSSSSSDIQPTSQKHTNNIYHRCKNISLIYENMITDISIISLLTSPIYGLILSHCPRVTGTAFYALESYKPYHYKQNQLCGNIYNQYKYTAETTSMSQCIYNNPHMDNNTSINDCHKLSIEYPESILSQYNANTIVSSSISTIHHNTPNLFDYNTHNTQHKIAHSYYNNTTSQLKTLKLYNCIGIKQLCLSAHKLQHLEIINCNNIQMMYIISPSLLYLSLSDLRSLKIFSSFMPFLRECKMGSLSSLSTFTTDYIHCSVLPLVYQVMLYTIQSQYKDKIKRSQHHKTTIATTQPVSQHTHTTHTHTTHTNTNNSNTTQPSSSPLCDINTTDICIDDVEIITNEQYKQLWAHGISPPGISPPGISPPGTNTANTTTKDTLTSSTSSLSAHSHIPTFGAGLPYGSPSFSFPARIVTASQLIQTQGGFGSLGHPFPPESSTSKGNSDSNDELLHNIPSIHNNVSSSLLYTTPHTPPPPPVPPLQSTLPLSYHRYDTTMTSTSTMSIPSHYDLNLSPLLEPLLQVILSSRSHIMYGKYLMDFLCNTSYLRHPKMVGKHTLCVGNETLQAINIKKNDKPNKQQHNNNNNTNINDNNNIFDNDISQSLLLLNNIQDIPYWNCVDVQFPLWYYTIIYEPKYVDLYIYDIYYNTSSPHLNNNQTNQPSTSSTTTTTQCQKHHISSLLCVIIARYLVIITQSYKRMNDTIYTYSSINPSTLLYIGNTKNNNHSSDHNNNNNNNNDHESGSDSDSDITTEQTFYESNRLNTTHIPYPSAGSATSGQCLQEPQHCPAPFEHLVFPTWESIPGDQSRIIYCLNALIEIYSTYGERVVMLSEDYYAYNNLKNKIRYDQGENNIISIYKKMMSWNNNNNKDNNMGNTTLCNMSYYAHNNDIYNVICDYKINLSVLIDPVDYCHNIIYNNNTSKNTDISTPIEQSQSIQPPQHHQCTNISMIELSKLRTSTILDRIIAYTHNRYEVAYNTNNTSTTTTTTTTTTTNVPNDDDDNSDDDDSNTQAQQLPLIHLPLSQYKPRIFSEFIIYKTSYYALYIKVMTSYMYIMYNSLLSQLQYKLSCNLQQFINNDDHNIFNYNNHIAKSSLSSGTTTSSSSLSSSPSSSSSNIATNTTITPSPHPSSASLALTLNDTEPVPISSHHSSCIESYNNNDDGIMDHKQRYNNSQTLTSNSNNITHKILKNVLLPFRGTVHNNYIYNFKQHYSHDDDDIINDNDNNNTASSNDISYLSSTSCFTNAHITKSMIKTILGYKAHKQSLAYVLSSSSLQAISNHDIVSYNNNTNSIHYIYNKKLLSYFLDAIPHVNKLIDITQSNSILYINDTTLDDRSYDICLPLLRYIDISSSSKLRRSSAIYNLITTHESYIPIIMLYSYLYGKSCYYNNNNTNINTSLNMRYYPLDIISRYNALIFILNSRPRLVFIDQ